MDSKDKDNKDNNENKQKVNNKIKNLKNPVFIKNCTDPNNKLKVKSIWVHKIMKDTQFKKNREKWDLKWQYYRDRNRTSIETFYKQNKGKIIKIIYFGDPVQYETYLKLNEKDKIGRAHV